jgi:hypothetical protein
MLKINVGFTKKVPGAQEFSSDGVSCHLEAEVADNLTPEQLQDKLHELYAVAGQAVAEQLDGLRRQTTVPVPPNPPYANRFAKAYDKGGNGNGNGNGNGHNGGNGNGKRYAARDNRGGNGRASRASRGSTQAQQRAIYALCKDRGVDMNEVLADLNVTDAKDLNIQQASQLIDDLQAQTPQAR